MFLWSNREGRREEGEGERGRRGREGGGGEREEGERGRRGSGVYREGAPGALTPPQPKL